MIDKILSAIGFVGLMFFGAAMDSPDVRIPIIGLIVSGILIFIEGIRIKHGN